MLPRPGSELGIYKLIVRLGAGGMGEVWKAEDTRLHRNVAIKLLPPSMTGDEELRARLLREARTAGQLSHPNIATIHGIELDGETPYIVMEYVEGETLTRAINTRKLSERQVADIGRAIADALAEAHAQGIVHRDIKPDNIVISGNRVKVLDFGIAKRFGEDAQVPAGEFVTEAGVVLGTVSYMSPEQATGKPLDGRSDIFALGVMLYHALAGRLPFRGSTNLETLKQILRTEPPALREIAPEVSKEMADLVSHCLRKKPEERMRDAGELANALAQLVARETTAPAQQRPAGIPVAPRGAVAAASVPVSAPRFALTNTQWAIAGASFALVLAVAGGFAAAKLVTPSAVVSTPAVAQAGSAGSGLTSPGTRASGTASTAAPPSAANPVKPAPAGQNVQGASLRTRVIPAPPAAATTGDGAKPTTKQRPEPSSPAVAPGGEYRAAIDGLEASGWHYLDEKGRLTPGASAAQPLLERALRSEPGNDSARLYLAVTRLFDGKHDAAATTLLQLLGPTSELDETERVLASFAYSAASVRVSGSDMESLERSLRANAAYLNGNAQLAAFAEDVRRLLARQSR